MIIGVGLDGRLGLGVDELGELGREAATRGFESIWTPAGGLPDAFHITSKWAETTRSVLGHSMRSGIGVVPAPRMWHPLSLAAQAATVSMLAGGNFVLGIGTGGAGARYFDAAGFPNRPIAVMRDYLVVLRKLLAGERVDYEGPALTLKRASLGGKFPPVEVYLAALGPQMLRLAGEAADGVSLNWASPEQIAVSRGEIEAAAVAAGREPGSVTISMYIRVCVDEDVAAARRAFAEQVLGYAMAPPGSNLTLAYRGHFGRLGFHEVLLELESRRDAGATMDELCNETPDEMLRAVGYYGPAAGAAEAFARLSVGLDEAIVRIVAARSGAAPVIEAMDALTPALIRAASA